MNTSPHEDRYLDLLLDPLTECANYKPKFGTDESDGVSLAQFTDMYGADPFYHWIGLDSPHMYAAHKAAGGMTSIYRQLGTGVDRLFRALVKDHFDLTDEQVKWSYEFEREVRKTKKKDKKPPVMGTRTLDARIDLAHIRPKADAHERVQKWLQRAGKKCGLPDARIKQITGVVFEARQGYKSADSKRAEADLAFGRNADAVNYMPVVAIVSTQASQQILRSYRNGKMLVLVGNDDTEDVVSTYAFFRNVIGFELDEFFKRNTDVMRKRCVAVIEKLLSPTG